MNAICSKCRTTVGLLFKHKVALREKTHTVLLCKKCLEENIRTENATKRFKTVGK